MPATPIDVTELYNRVAAVLSGMEVEGLTPLQGGVSSVTYWTTVRGSDGERKVVVKVAPAGLDPVRNRDVLRQAQLLDGLADSDVPVPRVLGSHPGSPPRVPPFFVMTFEPGDCIEPNSLPEDQVPPPEEVRDRELHAAELLGRLHRLDPAAVGFGAEPEVGLDAEVERWRKAFEACEPDLRVGHEDVCKLLSAKVPAMEATTLIHGDYRLGNTLSEGSRVSSIIDWEIWSRTDPRIDVAWFLMMANPDPTLGRLTVAGMPADEELLARYEGARKEPVGSLGWFAALVRYKQAAAGSIIARNARRRGEDGTAASTPALLASARLLLGG